jgi:hypothetical protein
MGRSKENLTTAWEKPGRNSILAVLELPFLLKTFLGEVY